MSISSIALPIKMVTDASIALVITWWVSMDLIDASQFIDQINRRSNLHGWKAYGSLWKTFLHCSDWDLSSANCDSIARFWCSMQRRLFSFRSHHSVINALPRPRERKTCDMIRQICLSSFRLRSLIILVCISIHVFRSVMILRARSN